MERQRIAGAAYPNLDPVRLHDKPARSRIPVSEARYGHFKFDGMGLPRCEVNALKRLHLLTRALDLRVQMREMQAPWEKPARQLGQS
nr:hypothetical protein [Edaphobacter sp. 12200R-103]